MAADHRPCEHLRHHGRDRFTDAPGSAPLNLTARWTPGSWGRPILQQPVLQALLYCHGLVIEDPLATPADL